MRLVLIRSTNWTRLVTEWCTWLTNWLNIHPLWNIYARSWTYWHHTSLVLSYSDICASRWRLELTLWNSLSINWRVGLNLRSLLINNVDISTSLLRSWNLLVLLMKMNSFSLLLRLLDNVRSESNMLFSNLLLSGRLFF